MHIVTEEELKRCILLLRQQSRDLGVQVDILAAYLFTQEESLDRTKKSFFEAFYYISNTSYEMMLFIDELFEAAEKKKFSHLYKYLAVLVYESKNTVPILINKVTKDAGTKVNVQHITQAKKKFVKDVNEFMKLLDLDEVLELTRNQAGAHHLDKNQDISSLLLLHGINRGAWAEGKSFYDNTIVATAVYLCVFLNQLAEALQNADNSGYVNELNAYITYVESTHPESFAEANPGD